MNTIANEPAAHDLLRQAHTRAYRFPDGFNGFRADISFTKGDQHFSGTVEIRSPRDLTLQIELEEAERTWVQREIASISGHRWSSPYEEGDGRYTLTTSNDTSYASGHLIQLHNDPFQSSYVILNGSIVQVNRTMGQMKFSINIQEHTHLPGNRTLPAHFTVAYWNVEQARFIRADTYSDRYSEVDGVYCPVLRRVITANDSGMVVRQLELHNHALLTQTAQQASAGTLEYRNQQ